MKLKNEYFIEKIAKVKLHEVAHEIIDLQMDIRMKEVSKLFFEKNWLKFIFLTKYMEEIFKQI